LTRVKRNQKSPLLRLPPEIRHSIWEYALGGHVLRESTLGNKEGGTKRYRWVPPWSERTCGLDLLRTCRQIYSETALLPYKLNTFSTHYQLFQFNLRCWLKPFQDAQISLIQLELISGDDLKVLYGLTGEQAFKNKLDLLPGLKRVHVLVFDPANTIRPFDEDCKEKVIGRLNALSNGRDLRITFEMLAETWSEYQKK
jgi:hypothetical protein